MANLYKTYGTDEDAEKHGVWVEFGEGAAFKLARAGGKNKNYGKVLDNKTRPHRRKFQHGLATMDLADKLMIETYAYSVVLDWKNIDGADGKPWPFSPANCIKLFTDLPDVFVMIKEEADKMQNFQDVELEEDAKN